MDPGPFSIYHFLPTHTFFIAFSVINVAFIVLVALAFYLLFLLNLGESLLKSMDTEGLEKLEGEDSVSYARLSQLFQNANSMDMIFALAKIFLSIVLILSAYFLLSVFNLSIFLIGVLAFLLVLGASSLLPIAFAKSQKELNNFGFQWTYLILKFCVPLANLFVVQKDQTPNTEMGIEDLKKALPEKERETISTANLNLYKQIFRFDKLKIRQVMRPKSELQGIKSNYNFKEVLQKVTSSQFSRLPVYEGNWNKVLGIVHCKDLLPHTQKEKLNWKGMIRPILYVQERDNAQQVLRQFQQSKNHMALVLNANKRLVGLVTLEDITEEIIGEIEDE